MNKHSFVLLCLLAVQFTVLAQTNNYSLLDILKAEEKVREILRKPLVNKYEKIRSFLEVIPKDRRYALAAEQDYRLGTRIELAFFPAFGMPSFMQRDIGGGVAAFSMQAVGASGILAFASMGMLNVDEWDYWGIIVIPSLIGSSVLYLSGYIFGIARTLRYQGKYRAKLMKIFMLEGDESPPASPTPPRPRPELVIKPGEDSFYGARLCAEF